MEDWAERLQEGTVLNCEIQRGTGPWEASDWLGKKVKGRIAVVGQWGTAKAGSDTLTCQRNHTAALGNPGKMERRLKCWSYFLFYFADQWWLLGCVICEHDPPDLWMKGAFQPLLPSWIASVLGHLLRLSRVRGIQPCAGRWKPGSWRDHSRRGAARARMRQELGAVGGRSTHLEGEGKDKDLSSDGNKSLIQFPWIMCFIKLSVLTDNLQRNTQWIINYIATKTFKMPPSCSLKDAGEAEATFTCP